MSAYRAPLQLDSVTKRYGDGTGSRTPAVDGLDLAVHAGTVYGLLGPTGAGKTTVLRLLAGLAEPTAGRVRVAGASTDDRDALVERIGYLPAEPSLPADLTGRERLAALADLRDVRAGAAADRVESLAGRVGVDDALDDRLGTLPPGTRRAIAFLGAVLHEPRVLLVDEPGRAFDPATRSAVSAVVDDLTARGSTAVVASRRLERLEAVADRLGVVYEGRLVAEGSPDALRAMAAVDGSDPVAAGGVRPVLDARDAYDAVVERVVVPPDGEREAAVAAGVVDRTTAGTSEDVAGGDGGSEDVGDGGNDRPHRPFPRA